MKHQLSKIFAIVWMMASTTVLAEEKRLTLLHTSDEHSTLLPLPLTDYQPGSGANPTLGGFARLATKVKEIRTSKGAEPVLLLSSGDIMGGSPFAWLILQQHAFELDIMQQLGYAAMTIGNHEFDYGPDILAGYLKKGGYTSPSPKGMSLIASNLDIPTNQSLNHIAFEQNKIFTLSNGLKVGVFGLLGAGAYSLAPKAEPVTIIDQFEVCKKQVQLLKDAGADIIVLLSHSGISEDREMAKKVAGIDVILGGHDHIQTNVPEKVNGTIIVHPSYYLQYLGKLELSFDTESKKLSLLNEDYLLPLDHKVAEDSTIAALIKNCNDSLNTFLNTYTGGVFTDVKTSVIRSSFPLKKHAELKETTIGNFVADAMRIIGTKVTGEKVDFAFQGNGVIRADILPGTMQWSKGDFSLFDLLTIVGLGSGPDNSPGYPMISVYLTEKEIFNALEVTAMLSQVYGDNFFLQISGLKYHFDPGKSMWMKIPILNKPIPATMAVKSAHLYRGEGIQTADGKYLELDRNGEQLYHIVTDYYLAAFLPMVGEVLPKLEIVFKNKAGKVVTLDDCIVYRDGKEFKIWEAVSMYAADLKEMPSTYQKTQERIKEERGIPLVVWTISGLVILLFLLTILIRKLFRKKK